MQVLLDPSVIDYFKKLVTILLDKEYFGTYRFANEYVMDLVDSILHSLPYKYARIAPPYFNQLAPRQIIYYTTFVHNRYTQWYVFFSRHNQNGEDIYYVHHISNNHVDAKHFTYR
jgi:hypothetical protein